MRPNVYVILVFVAIFALGMWGQYLLNQDTFWPRFSELGYQVLMLLVLEGDWTVQLALPWQLDVARFLSPLILVTSIIFVATRDAWVTVLNSLLRFRAKHIVIAGLGEKSWQFIQSCRGHDYQIAVVELNPDNTYISRARAQGVNVIVGDVLEPDTLKKANLRSARHLVTFTGNDGTNVELAIKARDYLREFPDTGHQLRIHLHLDDTLVSERLESYDKFFIDSSYAEISFFSIHDSTARLLLTDYPPDLYAEAFGQRNIHFALYEFNGLARHILIEATRICQFANGARLYFSIFTDNAEARQKELLDNYPALGELCHHIEFIQHQGSSLNLLYNIPERLLQHITYHVICGDSDANNLQWAIALRSVLISRTASNSPILVRMQQSSGLAQLLESHHGSPEIPDGLYTFGMFEKVLHNQNILSDRMDQLARAIHEAYRRREPARYKPWRLAGERARKASRLQADHLSVQLRHIRCDISPEPNPSFGFQGDEVATLARMEHARWYVNKIYEGYKAGPERIEAARVNPFAKRWTELTEDQQQENFEHVASYPELLSTELNWGIKRAFVIGVTGHRLNKMDIHNDRLRASIEDTLDKIMKQNPNDQLYIMSPLAEGSDRLVARIAMETFNLGLLVPLPLPYELYMEDFGEDSLDEFTSLVGNATRYYELPMRFGNLEELGRRHGNDHNELRNRQYALVGAYICQRSDELIAIYDGEPGVGPGGTADVVKWRREGVVPEEYRMGASFRQLPHLRDPIVLNPNP